MKFSGMESVDDDMGGGRQHGHGSNAGEGGEEYEADPRQERYQSLRGAMTDLSITMAANLKQLLRNGYQD